MKKYYIQLMNNNATSLEESITNSKGQKIEFYEHPDGGDMSQVIAVCHEFEAAADTEFFDTDDFGEGSEYNPVFVNGELVSEYDL